MIRHALLQAVKDQTHSRILSVLRFVHDVSGRLIARVERSTASAIESRREEYHAPN